MAGLSKRLSSQLNRVGHHIRQTIVDRARATLGDDQLGATGTAAGLPEPIPERQEDINKQADAAIRDLFPRIPNTDRQVIIEHAFNKVGAQSNPTSSDPRVMGTRSHPERTVESRRQGRPACWPRTPYHPFAPRTAGGPCPYPAYSHKIRPVAQGDELCQCEESC